MHKLKAFISAHKVLTGIIGIVLIGSGYLILRPEPIPTYETATAEKATLRQEVNVTGTVTPVQEVDLAFERNGRIARIPASVGDHVAAGQLLAALENSELRADLAQAQAALENQRAKLDALLAGSTEEEVRLAETKVTNAEQTLRDTREALESTLKSAYTKADNAIRNHADQFFTNPRTTTPSFDYNIANSRLTTELEATRPTIEEDLIVWDQKLRSLTTLSRDELTAHADAIREDLEHMADFLRDLALAINKLSPSGSLTEADIEGYQADVSSARTDINTAISNLLSDKKAFASARSALAVAERERDVTTAHATPEEIAQQKAAIKEAEANVTRIKAQIANTTIRAPFSGTITAREFDPGEIVSSQSPILSLISDAQFRIEANIPEVDIAKVEIGDTADVTLDTYGDEIVFEARVTKIDPAATEIEGVPTYKTTLVFTERDERIRAGMTANVDILTAQRKDVVAISGRAIQREGGRTFVRVMRADGTVEERDVTTGLSSFDGRIEITEGLSAGEEVVLFEGS